MIIPTFVSIFVLKLRYPATIPISANTLVATIYLVLCALVGHEWSVTREP